MERLVSTEWLAGELGAADLVVLDATMHLPDSPRDAKADYLEAHVPGARFLDLASFTDSGSVVPKALPTAEQFAARLGAIGIVPSARVVLYDDSQIKSAARAWFIFDHFGFGEVAILNGGFAKWRAEGRETERGEVTFESTAFPVPQARREVRSKADMLANCATRGEQVVDARDAARFAGEDGSGSAGHIPGAANVHFPRLFAEDGTWKAPDALRAEFAASGVDLTRPVTASCNSGMSACVLLFGLSLAGKDDGALYDGSWMEWGADPATPKEQGAAR
ncbi:sulfurtransferase [Qipengyuania sp. 6B39]|uniref:sulfurtransferase n=1 Tax=Qipengyuania proteolytica TaxID=2867239 RepID=UPI001C8AE4CC|nr:sulfurtransferase [Qipengyuania proteolytica]MBX7496617.1 sulfurtransferase [Qipengyuania proteolytica]